MSNNNEKLVKDILLTGTTMSCPLKLDPVLGKL